MTSRQEFFATWKYQVSPTQSLTLAAAAAKADKVAVTAQNMGWDDMHSLTGRNRSIRSDRNRRSARDVGPDRSRRRPGRHRKPRADLVPIPDRGQSFHPPAVARRRALIDHRHHP